MVNSDSSADATQADLEDQCVPAASADPAPGPVLHGRWPHRFSNALSLTRSHFPATFRSAIGLVMVAFLLAGLLQIYGLPLNTAYNRAIAFISESFVRWMEPVPLGIELHATGSNIRASSSLLRVENLTSFNTSVYFFYLPFIAMLLTLAAWRYRLVTPGEIVMVLGMLVVMHVAGTSMRVIWGEAAWLSRPLLSPVRDWEFVLLQRLTRVYFAYGMQLWSGLAVALVLLRSSRGSRWSSAVKILPTGSGRSIGIACLILILPLLSFIGLIPLSWRITGHGERAIWAVELALAQAGRYDEAYKMHTESAPQPTVEEVPILLALAQFALRDDSSAAEHFYQRLLQVAPGQREANLYMGGRMGRLGRFAEAARHYQTALTIDPGNPEIIYQLGNCHLGMGDQVTARARFEQVVELRPESPRALAKLGWIHAAAGEPCQAMALYSRCLALAPDSEIADDVRRQRLELTGLCPGSKPSED